MPYEYGMNYFGGQESPPSTGTDEDELYKYFMSLSGPKKIPGIESAVPPQPMPTEPKKIPSEDPLYDEFMALPHPPPPLPPEPTRWEKARAMAERSINTGIVPSFSPASIASATNNLGGLAEAGLTTASGLGAGLIGAGVGAAKILSNVGPWAMGKLQGLTGGPQPFTESEKAMGQVQELFTAKPKTEFGGIVTNIANAPLNLIGQTGDTVAKKIFPKNPEAQAATRVTLNLILNGLIFKYGGKILSGESLRGTLGSATKSNATAWTELEKVVPDLNKADVAKMGGPKNVLDNIIESQGPGVSEPIVPTTGEPVVPPAEVPVPQGQIPEKVSVPSGEMPTPETMGKILGIPDLFMKMPIDELTELVDTGNEGARAALRVRVGAKTRMPGPGEIRGLGVEFVNERGEPISRAEAYRVKKNVSVTEKPTTVPTALQIDPVIQRTINSIKEATPVIGEQETLYSAERSKRLGAAMAVGKEIPGTAGYVAQLGALKGPLEKVAFELKNKIPPEDIDYIMQKIQDSPAVKGYDSISAKTAFFKLTEGVLPQDQELAHLTTAIGPELVKVIRDKRTTFEKIRDVGLDALGVSKAIMSSTDLSFGFRQGLAIAARHPIIFAKAWPKQFGWFLHENAYKASNELILNDPLYKLAKKAKLSLTDLGKKMATREEPFMSPMAEKIPIVGSVVRASNRAYTGMSNKLRMDTFKYLVNRAEKLGLKPSKNLDLTSNIAKVVNTGTGRGGLGAFERAAVPLNQIFFSPRLWASRLQMLNPVYYMKLDPFARKEALTTLFSLVGAGTTVLGLAKAAGAKVGMDPRSADFGKIIIGNTRIDIWGGFQQNVRLAAQLITGKLVSSTTGKITTLGEGYRPLNRMDILERTVGYKASPIFSFAMNLMKGTGTMGNKLNIGSEVATRFVPMVIQDAYDIYKDDPSLLPLSALGVFGVGLQTYKIKRGSRGW